MGSPLSTIWVVEKAKATEPQAAAALMGDYAVRAFASLDSFEKLLRVSRSQRPDLLVVDRCDVRWDERRLREFFDYHFAETPILLLVREGEAGSIKEPRSGRLFVVQKTVDSLKLSVFVDFVLRSSGGTRRNVIRYRGLMLDSEKLQCLVQPGDDPVSLPLKEAQLLRLLLERPGVCLSRQEIQKSLWADVRVTPRTIDSHVSRLRKRLGDGAVEIESVYGGGYRLK